MSSLPANLHHQDHRQLYAGILIGGASQRMGQDKASLPFRDGTLTSRLVQAFHRAGITPWLLGEPSAQVRDSIRQAYEIIPDDFSLLGTLGISDDWKKIRCAGDAHDSPNSGDQDPSPTSKAGPALALASALTRLVERHPDELHQVGLLLVAVDMPLFSDDHINHLSTLFQHGSPEDVSLAGIIGTDHYGLQPCCAIYLPRALPSLREYLHKGKRSLQRFIETSSDQLVITLSINRNFPSPYHYHFNSLSGRITFNQVS